MAIGCGCWVRVRVRLGTRAQAFSVLLPCWFTAGGLDIRKDWCMDVRWEGSEEPFVV